jgi:hypothetical protein
MAAERGGRRCAVPPYACCVNLLRFSLLYSNGPNVMIPVLISPALVLVSFLIGFSTRKYWSRSFARIIESVWVCFSAISLCVAANVFVVARASENISDVGRAFRADLADLRTVIDTAHKHSRCTETNIREVHIEWGDGKVYICEHWEHEKEYIDAFLQTPGKAFYTTAFLHLSINMCSYNVGTHNETPMHQWDTYCRFILDNFTDYFTFETRMREYALIKRTLPLVQYWFGIYAVVAGLRCSRVFVEQ